MSEKLSQALDLLEKTYGPPEPLAVTEPFELVLLENIAYLLSDELRTRAFAALRSQIGTRPTDILSASDSALLAVAKLGGMRPEARVEKLRTIARIALSEFGGDLNGALKLPFKQAKKLLMKFPSFGEPSAEKVLLFTRSYPVLSLDSNILRVLLRLGYGQDHKNYTTAYRSAQQAVQPELKDDFSWLIRAYQLLRRHGQEICRRSAPACRSCKLVNLCDYFKANQTGRNLEIDLTVLD